MEEIKALNESGNYRVHLFSGSEVDILSGGHLDYTDEIMTQMDYVVASVHSGLTQDEDTMTSRIINALEHPLVSMLGHLSGRLLLKREASKLNIQKIIDAACEWKNNQLNSNPMRLDMD